MVLASGAIGWAIARALAHFAQVDALTPYLATSPGGADTEPIIASSSPAEMPFVRAMQSARFIVVAVCGPALARLAV
jgi:uncharacterized membrane protein AbrB (regulator of aidB expression)